MQTLKTAAMHTQSVVTLPPRWLQSYGDFITKNAGAVGQVEGTLRSLSYLVPGRFRESEMASEGLNSGVQLLGLYHDHLLSEARGAKGARDGSRQHQHPHTRYTKFYCRKSAVYRRTATTMQVVQYTELLLEMMAKRRGDKARWRVVCLLEMVKALCRLILMRLTDSRPLPSPPLPEREAAVDEKPSSGDDDGIDTPSEQSEAGSEQWSMPRTSLTLPPLPSSEDIPSYLMSKVLTADDVKPPPALLPRVSGAASAAEILYIIRPAIYAAAMAYYSQRKNGKADWRPWLLGLSIEYGAQQLAQRDVETRRPGGMRGLTQLEREEMKKRRWSMAWWGMRGALYENVTKKMIGGFTRRLKGKPVLDLVGNFVEEYAYLWDEYYFSTATM